MSPAGELAPPPALALALALAPSPDLELEPRRPGETLSSSRTGRSASGRGPASASSTAGGTRQGY